VNEATKVGASRCPYRGTATLSLGQLPCRRTRVAGADAPRCRSAVECRGSRCDRDAAWATTPESVSEGYRAIHRAGEAGPDPTCDEVMSRHSVSWRATDAPLDSPCSSIPGSDRPVVDFSEPAGPDSVGASFGRGVARRRLRPRRRRCPTGKASWRSAIAHRTAGRCSTTDLRALSFANTTAATAFLSAASNRATSASLRRRHRTGVRRLSPLRTAFAQRYSLADAAHRHLQPAGGVHGMMPLLVEQPRRSPDGVAVPQRIVRADAQDIMPAADGLYASQSGAVIASDAPRPSRVVIARPSTCWCCGAHRPRWLGAAASFNLGLVLARY